MDGVNFWFAELGIYQGASALSESVHHKFMNIMYMIFNDASQAEIDWMNIRCII
jgi:hypothetical protein